MRGAKMNFIQFAALIIVVVFLPEPAHAYLDGGSASMLLQMILAGLVGAAMTIKMYWQKICRFARELFSSGKNKNDM
jgi:hypothetical protein